MNCKNTTSLDLTCEQLYSLADTTARAAVANMQVQAMTVREHANPLDDSSAVVRQYHVEDGICGFAWVKINPARGKFVNWLKKNKIGKTDAFEGGYMIWISDYNQSMQKKEAYACVFSKVLSDNGIRAYAMSRMD
jgi:hypothetical protein